MNIDSRHLMLLADLMSFKVALAQFAMNDNNVHCLGRNHGHNSVWNWQVARFYIASSVV